MKKLALILATLLIGMVSMAQSVSRSTADYILDFERGYVYFQAPSVDDITQADTLRSFVIAPENKLDAFKQYASVKLTENSGTAAVDVKWQGKYFYGDSWADISTATYTGTGSDTTIVFDASTANHYRFYRLLLDGDGTGTFDVSLTNAEVQFYK